MEETVTVLLKYKNIVQKNIDHHVLLKEKTMLQFLVYILDSPNESEVSLALEVIQLMVENPQNHVQLCSNGLLEALHRLSLKNTDSENAKLSSKLLTQLKKPSRPPLVRQSTPAHMFPSVVYILSVPGLTNMKRRDVEYAILCKRGVISVVVDTAKERCTVRSLSKVTTADLAASIFEKTGLHVLLVTKNSKGMEVCVRLTREPTLEEEDETGKLDESDSSQQHGAGDQSSELTDEDLPEYLPEEEDPPKASAITSLARFKTNAASFVRSASSFFSDSFYW
ncbi:armadillo repeat-containing protein 1 [Nesidiocoris tenuis]|uniref:Armadillo repeat-containing protein 1 n=1 Tax=Nesidiocoris tenuis TaxID=355587 RepID=A0ABN7B9J7_9HEMI|nr:armadillo repeat-containing protein 1 [Nesidiocoris tenuis]